MQALPSQGQAAADAGMRGRPRQRQRDGQPARKPAGALRAMPQPQDGPRKWRVWESKMDRLIVIKPPEQGKPGMPTLTQGTRVCTHDGQPIGGITRIELIAEPQDVWRARIDCHVEVPFQFTAASHLRIDRLNWWQRFCLWAGRLRVDRTDLMSLSPRPDRGTSARSTVPHPHPGGGSNL